MTEQDIFWAIGLSSIFILLTFGTDNVFVMVSQNQSRWLFSQQKFREMTQIDQRAGNTIVFFINSQGTIIINMNTFQITQNLHHLYPDIQGQLCSKHTLILNQLHKTYQKTYNFHPPSHYVIVNSPHQLIKGTHLEISMAMEQGIALILSKDAKSNELNISSNLFGEVVVEKTGKIINVENEPQLSEIVSRSVELAIEDLSLNKVTGGFIYIRFQQGQSVKSSRHQLLIALFMACIVINDLLQQYQEDELMSKLKSLAQFQHGHSIEHYFKHYNNRSLVVSREQTATSIKLDSKFKMVFMKLDFLDQKGQYQVPTLNPAQIDQAIGQLQGGTIDILALMNRISQAQLQLLKDQDILAFIHHIVNTYKIKAFLFARKYCIFLVENYRYAELIGKISRLIHQNLAKQSHSQSSGELQTRHRKGQISSLLFSSVPSRGMAVLDPSNSMWF